MMFGPSKAAFRQAGLRRGRDEQLQRLARGRGCPFGVKVCTLEPGGIRTDFKQRARERLPDLLPEYEPSVGPIYKIMAAEYGNSASDPKKIADVVVMLSNMDNVP